MTGGQRRAHRDDHDRIIASINAQLAEHQRLQEQASRQPYATDPGGRPVADEPQPLVAECPPDYGGTVGSITGVPIPVDQPRQLTPDDVAELERRLRRKFTKQIRKSYRTAWLDERNGKWVPVRRRWWTQLHCWWLWTWGRATRWRR